MAVVIRLQGLPVVAGSSDIRRFFSGLNIPDGGVHIIGGEKGEAFIIFATDEDARQAMSYSGGYIKGSRVEFFLSSKTEMQNILESSRKRVDRSRRERVASRWTGSSNSGGDSVSNLSASVKRGFGMSTYDSMDPLEDRFHPNGSQNSNTDFSKSSYNQSRKESLKPDNRYLYISGMPYSATEDDVVTFFGGLQVDGVIMFQTNGRNNGTGVVKFATPSDAMKGLQRDKEYMGERFIIVRSSQKETWIQNGGRVGEKDNPFSNKQSVHDLNKKGSFSSKEHTRTDPDYSSSKRHTHSRSPPRILTHTGSKSPPRRTKAHTSSRSPLRRVMVRTRSRSPPSRVMKHRHSRSPSRRIVAHASSRSPPRRVMARTHSRSPPRRVTARSRSPFSGSTRSHSPCNKEYYIHVKNLPPGIGKRDLRAFFGGLDIPSSQITFLKSYDDNKMHQDAIVMFRSTREYCSALGYHKHDLHGRQILLYTISKTAASQLAGFSETKSSPESHRHVKEKSDRDGYSGQNTCVYARNFQYDVTKVEVQKFFAGFHICDNDIQLLYDDKGIGLGEAFVKFRSEDEAQKAESLNHRRFLGTEVLLRCISEKQMQEFGIVSSTSEEKMQDHRYTYKRDQNVYPGDSQGLSTQGNLNHPSDSRHPSNDSFLPDQFRHPAPFTEYQSKGMHGHFTDGFLMSDSNFSGGSNHITLVQLENIPFRASPNEILDFFHGYKIIPESVSIQQNEYGMPSGRAVIALENHNEAMAAVNELNYRPIGKRKIRLCLV